jgi:hypothetical protein
LIGAARGEQNGQIGSEGAQAHKGGGSADAGHIEVPTIEDLQKLLDTTGLCDINGLANGMILINGKGMDMTMRHSKSSTGDQGKRFGRIFAAMVFLATSTLMSSDQSLMKQKATDAVLRRYEAEIDKAGKQACTVVDKDIATTYYGSCVDGKAHGLGRAMGRDTYIGEFSQGKKHGNGFYQWASGAIYYGSWVNDHIEGNGKYFYENGNRYEGGMHDGDRSGIGIMYYANGDRYEGGWVEGLRSGEGTMTWASGRKLKTRFAKGERIYGERLSPEFSEDADRYLQIESPDEAEWVINNLPNEKEFPAGKWYSNGGRFFLKAVFFDGAREPRWEGPTKNGYAHGLGVLKFEVMHYFMLSMEMTGYMVKGTFMGHLKRIVQSGAPDAEWYSINNEFFATKAEYDDYIHNRYKMGTAIANLKASSLSIRHAFKFGDIGTRYVPAISNEIYNTETLYNIGNTPVTRTTSSVQSSGGVNESVQGYTAVVGVTNNSDKPCIVNTVVGGSYVESKYYKEHAFLWFGKESANLVANAKYLIRTKGYLVKPHEEIKDQFVVGEKEPKDFQIGVSSVVPVDEGWVAGLSNALNGAAGTCRDSLALLPLLNKYLNDPLADTWKKQLAARKASCEKTVQDSNMAVISKKMVYQVAIPANYDKDFDNSIVITIKNPTNWKMRVIVAGPGDGRQTVVVDSGASATMVDSVKGVSPSSIKYAYEAVALNADGAELVFSSCPAGEPERKKPVATAPKGTKSKSTK